MKLIVSTLSIAVLCLSLALLGCVTVHCSSSPPSERRQEEPGKKDQDEEPTAPKKPKVFQTDATAPVEGSR